MQPQSVIGRYALYDVIASGGMATVHFGQLVGPVGFSRAVAIKRLHPRFSRDPEFVAMFVDEARLTARIRHPNVVPVLDVIQHDHELYLVMEYVVGISFGELLRRGREREARLPVNVVAGVICGALEGLHAAHETHDDQGVPLGIVHRDVSPSNILVGRDGVARVLDFGIAKAVGRAHITQQGEVKGKPTYMSPEQLRGAGVSRAADVHAAAVSLWEALAGRRAFPGKPEEIVMLRRRGVTVPPLGDIDPALGHFESVVARGLAQNPDDRWPSARAMADAIRCVVSPAMSSDIADWLAREAGDELELRARLAAALESPMRATALRAEIHAQLGTDPSVSWAMLDDSDVETWEDEKSSRARARADSTRSKDERALAALAARERDVTPTIIESTGPRASSPRSSSTAASSGLPPRPSARAEELEHTFPSAHDGGGRRGPSTEGVGTASSTGSSLRAAAEPPWVDESPTVARRGSRRTSLLVTLLVALILLAGVGVFRVLTGDSPPTDETTPSVQAPPASPGPAATTTERSAPALEAPAVGLSSSATSNPSGPDASASAPVQHSPTTKRGAPQDERPTAGGPAAGAESSTSVAASTSDPFDELGGRH